MLIPPKYFLTPKIVNLLKSIEASNEVIKAIDIPLEIEINIRRQSTLKSSLFSARIEGNDLTLDELPREASKSQKKVEVFNILKSLNWVYERRLKDLSQSDILKIHKMVMEGILEKLDSGVYRTDVGAIFNSAGIAIYLPPRPAQVPVLINKLITFINSNKEQFAPIKACISHYIFEKIHPFIDGNGRVGRILLQLVLNKEGYGMKGIIPIEEYLDSHRSVYYQVLESSEKDITDYLEFMLEAIAKTAEGAKELVMKKENLEIEDFLLPRRMEILNIIRDHRIISFDQIRRRFVRINERTLRYDLKKLQDSHLIRKRGATKGVYYEKVD